MLILAKKQHTVSLFCGLTHWLQDKIRLKNVYIFVKHSVKSYQAELFKMVVFEELQDSILVPMFDQSFTNSFLSMPEFKQNIRKIIGRLSY